MHACTISLITSLFKNNNKVLMVDSSIMCKTNYLPWLQILIPVPWHWGTKMSTLTRDNKIPRSIHYRPTEQSCSALAKDFLFLTLRLCLGENLQWLRSYQISLLGYHPPIVWALTPKKQPSNRYLYSNKYTIWVLECENLK